MKAPGGRYTSFEKVPFNVSHISNESSVIERDYELLRLEIVTPDTKSFVGKSGTRTSHYKETSQANPFSTDTQFKPQLDPHRSTSNPYREPRPSHYNSIP